ncbi:hypothetical protein [Candidatus Coxiella mudrowiae]|uniref:hypothetical protein n=1 Tax=Candidatus Coxiella mudrowiae TaxID=2054173 RepID=UPI001F441E6A|nr:hypothetical protein [Candidatus Coxiella mudrowiae]
MEKPNGDELILLERSFLINEQKQNHQQFKIIYNNQVLEAAAILCEEDWHIFYKASHFVLSKKNPKASMTNEEITDNQFIAPMSGTVIEFLLNLINQ